MATNRLGDDAPDVPETCFVAPNSSVIGDVVLGEDCSVWPFASVRADSNTITVGAETNVQDGAVLHTEPDRGLEIGDRVTVGHQAIVHACSVAEECLIGMDATVLSGADIGTHSIVAAGALVTEEMTIPAGSVVMGVPGEVVREVSEKEVERIRWNAKVYVEKKETYLSVFDG